MKNLNISLIFILVFLLGCVSQSAFDVLESEVQANRQYHSVQIDSVYEAIELNSFLIEAVFGQLIELKAEFVAIQIKNNQVFYIVKKGDSLWLIAENELNDPFKWVQISDLNELDDPDLIYPHQELRLK